MADPATPPPPARAWDRRYLALYALYVGLGLLARGLGWIHGDAAWFVAAARTILHGSFDLYSTYAAPTIAPPLGATYAYSPLFALLLAPFVGLADLLGLGDAGAERMMVVPLLLADILAMDQLRRLARAWRPAVDERFLFAGILLTLGVTGFLTVSAFYGHNEGLVLLFILLTLRLTPRHVLWGGLCAGLALATKQTAALVLLPIPLALAVGGWRLGAGNQQAPARNQELGTVQPNHASRITHYALRITHYGPGAALLWGGATLAVFAAFMLPAVVQNPPAVAYAFLTLPTRVVLFGPGLPTWLDVLLHATASAPAYAQGHDWIVQYANLGLFAAALLGPGIVIAWAARRGRPLALTSPRLLGLVAFGALTQIVFSKWVTGHYYQLPLAFVLLWDVVRTAPAPGRPAALGLHTFPWIGLGAAIVFRSLTPIATPNVGKDVLIFLFFALLAALTLNGLGRREEPETDYAAPAGRNNIAPGVNQGQEAPNQLAPKGR